MDETLDLLYEKLSLTSRVPIVIIALSVMLLAGYLMTRLTRMARLPDVTGYILAGIIIGPYLLDLAPDYVVAGTEFLPDIALAFIAFSSGRFFRFSALRRNGLKVTVITLAEALTASALVFCVMYFALRLSLPFSVVLAALASATAPASTMMTIRQTGAMGDFVDTLLQVVALDDIVGLVAYSAAVTVAGTSLSGSRFSALSIVVPLLSNAAVMALGGLIGWLLKSALPKNRRDDRLLLSVTALFVFCGVCSVFDISPLLGCMSMGMVYVNVSDDEELFEEMDRFSPPVLLMFFVRSGISFDLGALLRPDGSIGTFPLAAIGVIYFLIRIAGKYAGAWLGCLSVKKDRLVRDYLGLALIPQAGVAIGLAALGARILGGDTGSALQTIILSSSVLYELIGPASAKAALCLSRSYIPGGKE
ncbi:MAG: cation:proton antiporter [Clostridiales bacterium]|nr:cation:proton antiporter [Clostridiales bacterium]